MKISLLGGAFAAVLTAAVASSAFAQNTPNDGKSAGGGDCAKNAYNCKDAVNPLPKNDTVWLEKMTWMDVRDAMKAGKKTIIIATGGIEPNGPWLTLGKHNWVLETNCDAIARSLGDALCAPIVKLVPEGRLDPPSGHMTTWGTISVEEATYEAVLTDMVRSFKVHGFERVFMIGDSGGNIKGMQVVAGKLSDAKTLVAAIPEYYDYDAVRDLLSKTGVTKPEMKSDNLHDGLGISLNILAEHPDEVRLDQRIKAGKATLDGLSLADKAANQKLAKEVIAFRTKLTVDAIKKVLAEKAKAK